MKRSIALLLAATSCAFAAPPEKDREAILSMAGRFKVSFDFKETVPVAAGYEPLSKDYHEEAIEVVVVADDTPERITLQHLLVVGSKEDPRVIKHWAQVWTWEDTRILDYSGSEGDNLWNVVVVPAEQAKGKWSQLVTNVDDTPRYESLGAWTHDAGESSWTSEITRRPLPRREYTKRDDYDYLQGTNRHTLTANGWVHFQDNRKVVDRKDAKTVLSFEAGLNQYQRTDSELAEAAIAWWQENSGQWNVIRNFWVGEGEKAEETFSYRKSRNGVSLAVKFAELAETKTTSSETITEALAPYIATRK